jgi:hypothetical protein
MEDALMTQRPPTLSSRRHLLKAVGIVGAVASTAIPLASASADACILGILCVGGGGGSGGTGTGSSGSAQCFLRGMRVRTEKGNRRVETLKVGDLLPTRFGGVSPIRGIDSFTVQRESTGSWPQNKRMVRICRGALAENVPSADLCLTEAHAVFLDGVLVRINSLVNDVTIFYDDAPGRDALEFFHVEFDTHDIVEAEGAACESLQAEGMTECAPILEFRGNRSRLGSRLRSAVAPIVDRRTPLDVVRDKVEGRSLMAGA